MLRRTESIVEKMLTNWLALCLYDYMKDYAGSSLFVLFKAIKFQVRGVSLLFISVVGDPDPGSDDFFLIQEHPRSYLQELRNNFLG
jgi:hypothetical protein